MPLQNFSTEQPALLIEEIAKGNKKAFDFLFQSYYTKLCRSAIKYLRSTELSEEIVQDVFLSVWQRRESINISSSLDAYLFTSVKYSCLNYLKKQFSQPSLQNKFNHLNHPTFNPIEEHIAFSELEFLTNKAINNLPVRCRIIFDLSRNGGLTYKEIAKKLNISSKTVEAQMSIALTKIKGYLNKYWDKIILGLIAVLIVFL